MMKPSWMWYQASTCAPIIHTVTKVRVNHSRAARTTAGLPADRLVCAGSCGLLNLVSGHARLVLCPAATRDVPLKSGMRPSLERMRA